MEHTRYNEVPLEILAKQDYLAGKIMSLQYDRNPQLESRYDARQKELSLEDASYSLSYLVQAIDLKSETVFTQYISWLKALLMRLELRLDDVIEHFECMKEVLKIEFGQEAGETCAHYIDLGIYVLRSEAAELSSYIEPTNPLYAPAKKFLELILSGARHDATLLILDLAKSGTPIKDIYLNILQQVQREIGLLWQIGKISVAQEHYCTSITQLAISQLYPYIFNEGKHGKSMIATCVSGELHEVGIRMLSDIFELEGWDTWYLGANMPGRDVISTIRDKNPDLIAISATMSFHLGRAKELISSIRAAGIRTPIMVGGYPFIQDGGLWQKVGADASARDAEEALQTATRLVNSR